MKLINSERKNPTMLKRFLVLAVLCLTTLAIASPTKTAALRTVNCNTVDQLKAAMADAQPGDDIVIAAGVYYSTSKVKDGIGKFNYFSGLADGTAQNPITLRGASSTNLPILRPAVGSDYISPVMGITGDYWIIKDLEMTNGQRGLILDTANYCQIINLNINNIGQEGLHFRSNSSNNTAKNCKISNCGMDAPDYGEGIYIGSDKGSHADYAPSCNYNTIDSCILGPNIKAECIDVKEGTQNTVIKNCTFDATGISGANSADAFIDLKGGYTYVYNNTFNANGAPILASCIDFQQRTGTNSGYRNAIFNNTFNLGESKKGIPTARKKGGSPSEIHVWGNTRNPASPDFPDDGSGTLNYVTQSCPSWNILPCGGVVNSKPTVSITAPTNGTTISVGTNSTIKATATDSDGTITKVAFYNGSTKLGETTTSPYQYILTSPAAGTYTLTAIATDNDGATTTSAAVVLTVQSATANAAPTASITSPTNGSSVNAGTNVIIKANATDSDGTITKVAFYNGSTKLGETTTSPYQYTLSNAVAGTYALKAIATDNSGNSTTSSTVNLTVNTVATNSCTFNTPATAGLASFARIDFLNMYVLGTVANAPDATNFKKFRIEWTLATNNLNALAYSTNNGIPAYYVDLKPLIVQNFNSAQPAVKITGSGITNLDGDYWVNKVGANLVLVSKTKGFTLYFSNETTAPSCGSSAKIADEIAVKVEANNTDEEITIYPNPANRLINFTGLQANSQVTIFDLNGKMIETSAVNNNTKDVSGLNDGIYIVNIINENNSKNIKLIIKK